jgi:hypothetical protein
MIKWWYKFRINMLHATYHRNMKRAEAARKEQNIIELKNIFTRQKMLGVK